MWIENTTKTCDLVPSFFNNIEDFNEIFYAFDIELTLLKQAFKKTYANMFLKTADDDTLNKFCRLLNLSTSSSNKYDNISLKLSEIPPFSIKTLCNIVNIHTNGTSEIILNTHYSITVLYTAENAKIDTSPIISDIYNIVPANILVNIAYKYCLYNDLCKVSYDLINNKTWHSVLMNK